jgi:hypothetical protein
MFIFLRKYYTARQLRIDIVARLVFLLGSNPEFTKKVTIELAGLYGAGEEGMPGPYSWQEYCL